MAEATLTSKRIWEDTGATFLARILGDDGAAIVQADFGSISYAVFEEDATAAVVSGSLTVSDVVFDTYQTDARWTVDSTGYNFRHTVAASVFSTGNAAYRIEYKFEPTGDEPFYAVLQAITVETRTG